MRTVQQHTALENTVGGMITESKETRPSFRLMSYEDLTGNLSYYYYQLKTFLVTPSVVHYNELAEMRRKVTRSVTGEPIYNLDLIQLRLAADLLRLGRRQEAFGIMNQMEASLLEWDDPSRSLCYLLWIALLKAASNDQQSAYYLAFQIASHNTSPTLDGAVANFFNSLYAPSAKLFND